MKKFTKVLLAGLIGLSSSAAMASNEAASLDELLKKLEEGKIAQTEQNKAREAEFTQKVAQQDQLLKDAIRARDTEVATSARLETEFENNEIKLANLSEALDKRMGYLKELFNVLQQTAGDTNNKFETSLISAQIPDRSEFLADFAQNMGSSSKLASIEEIERLWFELQREMTESGKVTKFNTTIVTANGEKVQKEVTRVGNFSLIADGKYLEYVKETGTVAELIRQPSGRYLESVKTLEASNGQMVPFALDPTGGSILGLLVQAPNTQERVEQGGGVGFVIIGVGIVGLLISIERFISLMLIGGRVRRQLKSKEICEKNPLGRVMKVKEQYPNVASDTLELKLSEAILREVPKITKYLTFIKIISVVAPLLGLLGTVTGMINTFQAITLFGTGDPKLMAGGISQALVTTVLGLVVAIPTVFLYTMLNTRSRGLIGILQEQSAGILAERAEKGE
jgi:biopolymer transport protein ExbB